MSAWEELEGGELVESEAERLTGQLSQKAPNGHVKYLFIKAALGHSDRYGEAEI